jgi:hypothetical protein
MWCGFFVEGSSTHPVGRHLSLAEAEGEDTLRATQS